MDPNQQQQQQQQQQGRPEVFSPNNPFSNAGTGSNASSPAQQSQYINNNGYPVYSSATGPVNTSYVSSSQSPPFGKGQEMASVRRSNQSTPINPEAEMVQASARLANLRLGSGPESQQMSGASSSPSGPAARSSTMAGQEQQAFGCGYGSASSAAPAPEAHMTGAAASTVTTIASPSSAAYSPFPAQMTAAVSSGVTSSQAPFYSSPPQYQHQSPRSSNEFAVGYGPSSPPQTAQSVPQQMGYQGTYGGAGQPGAGGFAPPLPNRQDTGKQPMGAEPVRYEPLIGPLLQFVNVELERAMWHGSVLVLTNESLLPHQIPAVAADGSSMSPPVSSTTHQAGPVASTPSITGPNKHAPSILVWDDGEHVPGTGKPRTFTAVELYTEPTLNYTFWRADVSIKLPRDSEINVLYQVQWAADELSVQSLSARPTFKFRLPAQSSKWRMCVTNNNQFSRSAPPSSRLALGGSGPVFNDLANKHKQNPFHLWIGTGGQFNGGGVWDECASSLHPFLLAGVDSVRRAQCPWTLNMAAAVEQWYFLEYLKQWFGVGLRDNTEKEGQEFFCATATSIPYTFAIDSEIVPFYGSYSAVLQNSRVFHGIGSIASKYYALFQLHTTAQLAHSQHRFIAEGFHSIKNLGPYTTILTLDTRTERTLSGVIQRKSYDAIFHSLGAMVPTTTRNLVVVAANPVVFPRTKNVESVLKKANSVGLTTLLSFAMSAKQTRNTWMLKDRFGESAAVTMLNDFWTCSGHHQERHFLVRSMQDFAKARSCRVTFVSGHVNCLSTGLFYTFNDSKCDPHRHPEQRGFVQDYRSMIQLTISGLVDLPAEQSMVKAYQYADKHSEVDRHTGEKLYSTFPTDVDGLALPNGHHKFMGRRSYGIIIENVADEDHQHPGLLSFLYVEKENSTGTVAYIVNIPPLRYSAPASVRRQQPPALGPSMSYRDHTGAAPQTAQAAGSGSAGGGGHAGPGVGGGMPKEDAGPGVGGDMSKEDAAFSDNPYEYAGAEGHSQGESPGQGAGIPPPPPYSPTPPPSGAAQGPIPAPLPPRTSGSYSSSYEHTAAWVQQQGQEQGQAAPSPSTPQYQQGNMNSGVYGHGYGN